MKNASVLNGLCGPPVHGRILRMPSYTSDV